MLAWIHVFWSTTAQVQSVGDVSISFTCLKWRKHKVLKLRDEKQAMYRK